MNFRSILSLVVLIVFCFAYTTQDLQAPAANEIAPTKSVGEVRTHAVSQSDLHQAVMASQQQANEARRVVREFLARPAVKAQVQRLGLIPDKVAAQSAMLGDNALMRLEQQIMNADMQNETAGLSKTAIILIVVAGIVGTILLIWLLVEASEDIYYY
jgi:hypothetical protein